MILQIILCTVLLVLPSQSQLCTRRACGAPPSPTCKVRVFTEVNGPGCLPVCPTCADDLIESNRQCTRRGCSSAPVSGGCGTVVIRQPNGPGCGPLCEVCADDFVPQPDFCTLIGCGAPPPPSCQFSLTTHPNGPWCGACKVCADDITNPPNTCGVVDPGFTVCPPTLPLAECPQGYVSFRPNGPGCEPQCTICGSSSPANEGCKTNAIFFPIPLPNVGPTCGSDSDCRLSEKCCPRGNLKTCQEPVSTVPRSGRCPIVKKNSPPPCIADFAGCTFDSECGVNQKCCGTACGYKECKNKRKEKKRCVRKWVWRCPKNRRSKRKCRWRLTCRRSNAN